MVRFQGPRANGMLPGFTRWAPALGVLQDRGRKVALVTDGRMSGASGKTPAAIHLTPEAADGGLLARIRTGGLGFPPPTPRPAYWRSRSTRPS